MTHPALVQSSVSTPVLARWDARLRLLALLFLAFAFSSVRQLYAVPPMLLVTAGFWLFSGMSLGALLRRLRYPSLLIACMALAVLFREGQTVLFQLGDISISQEGVQAAVLLLARFYCILTLAFTFLSVSPLLHLLDALRALGVPFIMVDMGLLMVRYLETLKQDLHNMQLAAQLRGFQNRGWSMDTVKTKAWLAASLLLRSYERADGVYKAMRLRGYGQKNVLHKPPLSLSDWFFFGMAVLLAGGIFWLG